MRETWQSKRSYEKQSKSDSFVNGYALIIGISAYRHLPSLATPAIDAHDLCDVLVDYCGYPPNQVTLLLDEQATKHSINAKLEWLARHTTTDDTILIFFSGHGGQRLGGFEWGEYFCPVDTDLYNLRKTAISVEELRLALRIIPARRLVIFLDICHSNQLGLNETQIKAGFSTHSYDLLLGAGCIVIASCKPNELSRNLSGMRNGLFTHYLLRSLRGGKENKVISIVDVFQDLSREVSAIAQSNGVVQTPMVRAYSEDFPIGLQKHNQNSPPASNRQRSSNGGDKTSSEDETVKAYAIALLKNYDPDSCFYVGKAYVLQAGIRSEAPEGFARVAISLPSCNHLIDFEIAVYAEDIDVQPAWSRIYTFNRDENSPLLEFALTPTTPGTKHIRVEYYYERHWLAKIEFEVEVIEAEVFEPVSSFQ